MAITSEQARAIGQQSAKNLTKAQAVTRARHAALVRWANEDPKANAERGQAGLRAKFERETRQKYPDLTEAETLRRADCAYRAHMARLSFQRSRRAQAGGDAA